MSLFAIKLHYQIYFFIEFNDEAFLFKIKMDMKKVIALIITINVIYFDLKKFTSRIKPKLSRQVKLIKRRWHSNPNWWTNLYWKCFSRASITIFYTINRLWESDLAILEMIFKIKIIRHQTKQNWENRDQIHRLHSVNAAVERGNLD